ncbi:MAG: nicotinamide-nucleotide amidohydrolase family protein [Thermoleophilia bacterium]|nr:nicotinamide-nucleotide amidohydrolase family protein [Thermoleophilia bacterium]
MRAAVVVTGDEVLHGRVTERNAAFLCAWLEARGVDPVRVTVLPDRTADIAAEVRDRIHDEVDLVVTSGGLGITHDDVTMAAVAAAVGVPTALHEEALVLVGRNADRHPSRFLVSQETRDATDRKQATLPVGARMLPPVGTAPGCALEAGGTLVLVLPGPPGELQAMWLAAVEHDPGLRDVLARTGVAEGRRVLRIHDVVESQVVEALDDARTGILGNVRMGICARIGELELTLADAGVPGGADAVAARLEAAFGAAVFSRDGAPVEVVIGRGLAARREVLAVAESCTGGMIGERLTAVPGSSEWFAGGVIAYANGVKRDLLGVPRDALDTDGAVSEPVARAMAVGARRALGTGWALSVTGVAGPGGGTPAKPVGLVYIGCAAPDGAVVVHEHRFRGDREVIRQRAAVQALHLLRVRLATA